MAMTSISVAPGLDRGAQDIATDAAEAVDGYANRHALLRLSLGQFGALLRPFDTSHNRSRCNSPPPSDCRSVEAELA